MTMMLRRFYGLLVARNKEFYRDRSTLLWTFVFPLLVIAGFGYGYSGKPESVFKVGVAGPLKGGAAAQFLTTPSVEFYAVSDLEGAIPKVKRHQVDLLLDNSGSAGRYWINPSSPKGKLAERVLLGSGARFERQEASGREIRYVDWLVPGIIGMNLMFSSLFGVGYVIVRYRKNGVLKRIKATPATAFEFLSAQIVSRLLLILVTSALTFAAAWGIVRFEIAGSLLDLGVFVAVGSLCMVSVGMVVAARISSEEVADGVLNLMTWPMMLLSGVWFSLEGASPVIRGAAQVFPLTHVVDGMRAIVLEGAGLGDLLPQLAAMGGVGVVFVALGSLIFKWN